MVHAFAAATAAEKLQRAREGAGEEEAAPEADSRGKDEERELAELRANGGYHRRELQKRREVIGV